MGLDMSLNANRYLSSLDKGDVEKMKEMMKMFPELQGFMETVNTTEFFPFNEVSAQVGYWRKANAIHNWFVQNIQEGEDDCKAYNVSREQLGELKSLCEKVLADNSLAEELLPPTGGFFFGSTDIDEYYFTDLRNTIEIIDHVLALPDNWFLEYQSSW